MASATLPFFVPVPLWLTGYWLISGLYDPTRNSEIAPPNKSFVRQARAPTPRPKYLPNGSHYRFKFINSISEVIGDERKHPQEKDEGGQGVQDTGGPRSIVCGPNGACYGAGIEEKGKPMPGGS